MKTVIKEFHGNITVCIDKEELSARGGSISFYDLCEQYAKEHNTSLETATNTIFHNIMEELEDGITHY